MTWTPIAKPTSTPWTSINTQGKEQYDEASLTYDDATTYYDGVNPTQWTSIAKPAGGLVTRVGMATGLIMPPTYSGVQGHEQWTKVAKPIT